MGPICIIPKFDIKMKYNLLHIFRKILKYNKK